eukprot:CAMPEP_0176485990 /NCGR_PEP_ID=MMETSP0200_2-20121128/5332_1 /TAXON_ID=947934 /ORGANISM="Chaetoceros sp., Strain GSL56" /LENGTH=538 /DNA_ID=CAMNT_0017882667 /DNA_START=171 /DNA_END=1785 /DNA_ORIENTATION=+
MDTPQSFHRRPLPTTCISLSSQRGQDLFQSSMRHNGTKAFFDLISQYHTQTEPAYCGPSTLVMILNALNVDPRKPWKQDAPWRWYSEEMLNCCMDLETIKKTGITFSTFVCLAKCQGLCADGYYASESTLEEFQRAVEKCCSSSSISSSDDGVDGSGSGGDGSGGDGSGSGSGSGGSGGEVSTLIWNGGPTTGRKNITNVTTGTTTPQCHECNTSQEQQQPKMYLAVSYDRQVLQQTGRGHFSPIAAYDKVSNHVLILDTARFKYTPHWVPLDLLFRAMQSVDSKTNKSRGFIVLSFEPDEQRIVCSGGGDGGGGGSLSLSSVTVPSIHLPQSILFRSKRSQNPARKQFKEFLNAVAESSETTTVTLSPLTFQQVYNYWTDHGKNIRKVWSILEPAPIPIDREGCDTVQALLSLIRKLLRWNMGDIVMEEDMDDKFVPCSMRTVPITALETIYVIYLSTLERRDASEAVEKCIDGDIICQDGDNVSSSSIYGSENGHNVATNNNVVTSQLLAEADLIKKAIELSTIKVALVELAVSDH